MVGGIDEAFEKAKAWRRRRREGRAESESGLKARPCIPLRSRCCIPSDRSKLRNMHVTQSAATSSVPSRNLSRRRANGRRDRRDGRARHRAASCAADHPAQTRPGAGDSSKTAKSSSSTSPAASSKCSRTSSPCSPIPRCAPSDLDEAAARQAKEEAERVLAEPYRRDAKSPQAQGATRPGHRAVAGAGALAQEPQALIARVFTRSELRRRRPCVGVLLWDTNRTVRSTSATFSVTLCILLTQRIEMGHLHA